MHFSNVLMSVKCVLFLSTMMQSTRKINKLVFAKISVLRDSGSNLAIDTE